MPSDPHGRQPAAGTEEVLQATWCFIRLDLHVEVPVGPLLEARSGLSLNQIFAKVPSHGPQPVVGTEEVQEAIWCFMRLDLHVEVRAGPAALGLLTARIGLSF